jgi:hypothetical protein
VSVIIALVFILEKYVYPVDWRVASVYYYDLANAFVLAEVLRPTRDQLCLSPVIPTSPLPSVNPEQSYGCA